MTEDIGNFKVVISGSVDKNIGSNLEKSLNLSALEKKIKSIFSGESFGNFTNKISGMLGGKGEPASLASDVGAGASQGAAAGGQGALAGGLMTLAAKISIGIGLIGMVLKALEGLAPLQGLMKLMVSVLQLTLYPIMQFFLAIFKPIIVLLLKYLILPFYNKVMPVIESLGKWLGGMVGGVVGGVGKGVETVKDAAVTAGGTVLDWGKYIGKITWDTFVKILDWAIFVGGVIWDTFIAVLDWAVYIATMVWSNYIAPFMWNSFVTILNWVDFVARFVWTSFLKILAWTEFIPKLIWDLWAALLSWADFIPRITWPDFGQLFSNFLSSINPFRSSSGGSPPRMAAGGIVNSPTVALIGESGPEMVIPLSKMNTMGNTTVVNVSFPNMVISAASDIDKIVKEIERTFYTNSKRAGI